MAHECPRNGCVRRVGDEMLACRTHWYLVSPATRRRVWTTYKAGDVDEHREAMADAISEMNANA